jgi:hypothetical protein
MAYNLNLDSGEIESRTLKPGEVTAPPPGPSVKPLPKMGGDLSVKKNVSPFGPVVPEAPKKKLFDDDGPKEGKFEGDFFKRDDAKKVDPFGDGGFQRVSGAKKLAEIFAKPEPKKAADPFAKSTAAPPIAPISPISPISPITPIEEAAPAVDDPRRPRIPAITDDDLHQWMFAFAKEFGDPEIRDEMGAAVKSAKPQAAWERLTRKHIRAGQQWERFLRKQALDWAEAWLSDLRIEWELVES